MSSMSRDGVAEPVDHHERDWKDTLISHGVECVELAECPLWKKMTIEVGLAARWKGMRTKKPPASQR
jgi:hypothetical protein